MFIYGKVSPGTGELDRQLLSLGKPRAWEGNHRLKPNPGHDLAEVEVRARVLGAPRVEHQGQWGARKAVESLWLKSVLWGAGDGHPSEKGAAWAEEEAQGSLCPGVERRRGLRADQPQGQTCLRLCTIHINYEKEVALLLKTVFTLVYFCWVPHAESLSRVWLFVTPRTVSHQAPLSMGFSSQEYWSGLLFPPHFFYLKLILWHRQEKEHQVLGDKGIVMFSLRAPLAASSVTYRKCAWKHVYRKESNGKPLLFSSFDQFSV